MESNSEASCISDPNFAVICAFLERFAKSCGIAHPPFLDLQEMLENIEEVPQELIDLHIILLRKARRSVFREKWEKALVKFCQIYSTQDGWEIERFGYKNSRLEVKLRVLKNLLEGQFDLNCKFKTIINTHESSELRSKPVGKDKNGRIYWLQIDPISNIRVYREDLDEESWTLVAKDRDSLVQLLQELSADEESLDVNLLNEDSSISVDIEKTILDTGQENGNSDLVTNGDAPIEEKDPLEIKSSDNMVNNDEYEDCQNGVLTSDGKRGAEDLEEEVDLKKVKLDDDANGVEVGEAIDDPVMHIYGEGNGEECDAGNPDKEDHKTTEGNSSNTSEQSEPGQTNSDLKKIDLENKPQPKLWSIDTICGTGSFNHSGESSKNVKSVQKSFSSFSIESVLEKKSDSNHSSSPVPESSVVSANAITTNDPTLSNVNQTNEHNVSIGHLNVENSESQLCNASTEDASLLGEEKRSQEEEKAVNYENESDAVPNFETEKNIEGSIVRAENYFGEKETKDIEKTKNDNVEVELKNNDLNNEEKEDIPPSIDNIETSPKKIFQESDKEASEPTEFRDVSVVNVPVESNGSSTGNNLNSVQESYPEHLISVKEKDESSFLKVEKNLEDNEDIKTEITKIGEPLKEVSSDQNENADINNKLEGQEDVNKRLSPVDVEATVADQPRKEAEEINSEVLPHIIESVEKKSNDEHVKPLQDVQTAEDQRQPEEELEIKEVDEVSPSDKEKNLENLVEHLDEQKLCETTQKLEEKLERRVDETTVKEELGEIESVSAEQDKTRDEIPQEKLVTEEVSEVKKNEVEMEHEEATVSPAIEENIQADILESSRPEPKSVPDALTEQCKEEVGHAESPTQGLISEERVKDDDNLPIDISTTFKTEVEQSGETDAEEKKEIKEEAREVVHEDLNEPTEECKQTPEVEITEKEESTKSEETCLEMEKKETEERIEISSEIPSGDTNHEKELPPSDETKDESLEGTINNMELNEIQEEAETKAQPAKIGRKRKRSRKQSSDSLPARATRSAKKSIDEDTNPLQEVPAKEAKKRKSQDSDNLDMENITASTQEEGTVAADAEEIETEKRRDSTANSLSDENSTVIQEEGSGVAGKRMKISKKIVDSQERKSVEEKQKEDRQNSSEDESKTVGEGETAANEEEKKKKSPKTKAKDGAPRTRQLIPERELKLLGISNMEELPTVRQSRRIAQLKLKEEAERNRIKKLEEAAKEEEKREKKKKKKKKKLAKQSSKKRKTGGAAGEESYEEEADDDEEDDDDEQVKQKEKKRRKKKDKLVFNELNPWISSSGSSSADEEDEEIDDEAHEEEEILFKSDHEFSPESDIEDPDYRPIKRARTAKVDPKDATEADSKYDDTACEKCAEKDHPEWILLCDKCDKGWHASCVRPALMVVPEGDWFCPPCEHTSLIQKLRESLVEYDRCQKQRENEELRRKRLAFVGISLDNVLPSKKEKKPKLKMVEDDEEGESEETASENGGEEDSSSSGSSSSESSRSDESSEPVYQLRERRTNVTSYRYNEYDELIKSALQEEMEAAKGVGLGKGKDINNQSQEYEEGTGEGETEERSELVNVNIEADDRAINPQIPRDILEAKPRLKPKKEGDQDYEAETDGEEDEDYNEEENGEAEEEDEEMGDEVPPVVPHYDKKKKKTRSLNVRGLDFTSDEEEEDNSDSDFKGESSEEESEYSLPSESESSDGIRKRPKSFDGPLRRSTRARTARYDKEFINDDSEDETPRKKKSRNVWVESESSDSDRSWGRRKKRGARSSNRSAMPKKKTKSKAKKKKSKKKSGDSDYEDEEKAKKSRNRKIKYGGLDELDEEQVLTRRTRGKKINYQEMNASDSEDEVVKRKPRVIGDSDEEFVAEKEKSYESEGEDEGGVSKTEANGKAVSKKSILRKIKKKRPKVIPDPDDFSEDDLLEDEELDEFAEELEDLDEEEEDMLQEMLNDGDVPIRELKEALGKLKERRREKSDGAKPYPPIPEHMENPGLTPRFPRIGKMKVTPSRSELAAQLSLPSEPMIPGVRSSPGILLGNLTKEGESLRNEQPGNMLLVNEPKTDSKEGIMNLQPPPYPFPVEGPPGVPSIVNAHAFPLNSRPPAPPYNSFQGIIPPHTRMPPEYPHPNIPTTVLGLENDALQDIRKQGQKPASNSKRKNEDGMSPQADSGEENSGDGRIGESVDSPKRRGRGRGKKQLLAEAQAKQEIAISTVQAPTQFPPRGPVPEGATAGSVITRMLNTPQGPQPFPPDFSVAGRGRPSFRPPYPNTLRPPLNPPSPSPLRATSTLPSPSALPLFHVTLPLDMAPSSISLAQGKAQLPPGFPPRTPVLPRYPSDPSMRPPFPSHSSSRSDNYPYPNFYPGPFPPPLPNNEEATFHNPNFPNHPFDEHSIPGADGTVKPPYEEEAGGEFGGLASYFASQREDDLDT